MLHKLLRLCRALGASPGLWCLTLVCSLPQASVPSQGMGAIPAAGSLPKGALWG